MHSVNLLFLLEHLVFLSKKRRVHAVCEVAVFVLEDRCMDYFRTPSAT